MYTPKAGDFGLVAIKGGVGRLIRIGQWLAGDGYADYEHAFIYVGNNEVVEARPKGAGYASLAAYTDVDWYACPDVDGSNAVGIHIAQIAVALKGTPYSFVDYAALAAIAAHLPLSSRLLRHYVADSGHMICSQLVDYCYMKAGVHLFNDGRLPGDVTPGDLYGLVVQQQNTHDK